MTLGQPGESSSAPSPKPGPAEAFRVSPSPTAPPTASRTASTDPRARVGATAVSSKSPSCSTAAPPSGTVIARSALCAPRRTRTAYAPGGTASSAAPAGFTNSPSSSFDGHFTTSTSATSASSSRSLPRARPGEVSASAPWPRKSTWKLGCCTPPSVANVDSTVCAYA